jgi:hypothetical protein
VEPARTGGWWCHAALSRGADEWAPGTGSGGGGERARPIGGPALEWVP